MNVVLVVVVAYWLLFGLVAASLEHAAGSRRWRRWLALFLWPFQLVAVVLLGVWLLLGHVWRVLTEERQVG